MSGATRWRRPTGALAVLIGLVLLALAVFSGPAQGSTSSVTDPTGDVTTNNPAATPVTEPRGDITSASMTYSGNTITGTLTVQQFDNPNTSANWKSTKTAIAWRMANNGHNTNDFNIVFQGGPNGPTVSVLDGQNHVITCQNATLSSANSTYSATVPAACVGLPSSFTWAALMVYDPGNNSATTRDAAPNSGVVGPVTNDAPPTTTTTAAPTTTTTAAPTTTTTAPPTTTTTVFIPGANNAAPSGFLTPSTVSAGGPVGITSSGWFPNASVTVTLHSDPVVLGTFSTDSSGRLSVTVVIPGTTAAGAHTLDLTGVGADGVGHDVALALNVTGPVTPANSTFTPAGGSAKVKGLSVTGRSVRTEVAIGIWFVILGLALLRAKAPRRFRFGNPLR